VASFTVAFNFCKVHSTLSYIADAAISLSFARAFPVALAASARRLCFGSARLFVQRNTVAPRPKFFRRVALRFLQAGGNGL
jgi:hypothetical protein